MDNEFFPSQSFSAHLLTVPPRSPNPWNERIYHYTRPSGFEGIIKSKEIWATNAHYLNDYDEVKGGFNRLKILSQQMSQTASKEEKPFFVRLESAADQYAHISIYIISFTENGDLLSQWRGYANPSGYSIGFALDELRVCASKQGFNVFKCIYSDGIKDNIINELLNYYLSKFQSLISKTDENIEILCYDLMKIFYRISSAFKDKSFAEENEWRIVSNAIGFDRSGVDVRSTSTLLIPFFHFSIDFGKDSDGKNILCFDQIVTSPNKDRTILTDPVGILLRSQKIRWKSISPSQIPYRTL